MAGAMERPMTKSIAQGPTPHRAVAGFPPTTKVLDEQCAHAPSKERTSVATGRAP
jgi:hypothetical protein